MSLDGNLQVIMDAGCVGKHPTPRTLERVQLDKLGVYPSTGIYPFKGGKATTKGRVLEKGTQKFVPRQHKAQDYFLLMDVECAQGCNFNIRGVRESKLERVFH